MKDTFSIAIDAVVASLRNIHKDIEWRREGKRTYAKHELVSISASLTKFLRNEKVSNKTLKELGIIDKCEISLDEFAELTERIKYVSQKSFLIENYFDKKNKKIKKKSSKHKRRIKICKT